MKRFNADQIIFALITAAVILVITIYRWITAG